MIDSYIFCVIYNSDHLGLYYDTIDDALAAIRDIYNTLDYSDEPCGYFEITYQRLLPPSERELLIEATKKREHRLQIRRMTSE